MSDKQAHSHGKYMDTGSFSVPTKPTSMCSLIIWNISKALENNPSMDLTRAVRAAHERLEHESRDESRLISQAPEERHLTCALLAWHQLGHSDVDGLCKFIQENRNKPVCNTSKNLSNNENIENVNKAGVSTKPVNTDRKRSESINDVDSSVFDTCSLMGPVVKLPVETKIVMRFTPPPPCQHHLKKPQKTKADIKNKIDAACCMDSSCIQRLAELEQAVNELRNRAAQLARREAERVELLERAEAGWKDLELGYQRRLSLAEEKEDDMAKQIKKSIEERNSCKNISTNLAELLKQRGATAEKERERLKTLEKEVCDRACIRMRLGEESAKGDAALAEQLCRASQLDRDLQFKEEQASRKVKSLESELESSQCVTYEAERAMRFELSALKEQVTEVSKQLLAEEDRNNSIKTELEQYRQEKANIIEDLDGCKDMCDSRMKARMDALNQKRDQLKELKDRVMDCQCKLPLDVAIEVKRTPSLAALCRCSPEDKLVESCSCTSLRSQLLSNLLADLFGGLQAELSTSGVMMPCALLLCLDDRHNWDRTSAVKTSLRSFFAQLLVGELDIAIATSIEKYHAKWVGESCADKAKLIPDPREEVTEGWEQRAVERRAQQLATKLAEQMFEERAEELKQKAKDIVSGGPPPCECKGHQPAVYSCLVKTPTTNTAHKNGDAAPSNLRRTIQDVKHQIEDLKKESIKKEDLRQMEEKIAKIIQRAAKVNYSPTTSKNINCIKHNPDIIDGKSKTCDENGKNNEIVKRKEVNMSNVKKHIKKPSNNQLGRIDKKSNKMFKKLEQSFAVNLCLCSGQDAPNKLKQPVQRSSNCKSLRQQQISGDSVTNIPSIKQSKPIPSKEKNNQTSKLLSTKTVCPSDCICFHKIPSNTSIDKLLETLSKWNGSLNKILEDTNFSCDQTENENKSLNSALVSLENKKGHSESSIPVNQTSESYKFKKEDYNKDTSYGKTLPPTTESEYLGAINLDKSNYNICRCPVNNNTKIMYGDGEMLPDNNMPFHCINADICKCKDSISSKQLQDPKYYEYMSSKINNISQAYSVELENPKFKTTEIETNSLKKTNSTKSVEISEDIFIHDIVRKSQLFPNKCDYFVKFLGVTLTNSSSLNKTKQGHDNNNILKTSAKVTNNKENMIQKVFSNIKINDKKSSILSTSIEKSENKKIEGNNLDFLTEKNNVLNEVIDMNKDICVCCNNKETSKDLELNTFNLLEEHIKRKLEEFLLNSSKSSFLPPEEENKLFSTILFKVKEVISESTKGLSCECCEASANEGSWSRAYGMLQEYLKVKIKRVQCSCVSSDGNVESILAPILEKVCDLIENDFQRLKEKFKCSSDGNKNTDKLNRIPITNVCNAETFTRTENDDDHFTKNSQNVLCQSASCILFDKSAEVLESISTSEKKKSCEFKIYGTDCNCQHTFSELTNLNVIVNQGIDLASLNNNSVKVTLNTSEEKHPIESSLLVKKNTLLKNKECIRLVDSTKATPELKAKIPYIGYTFSTKSLVQNDTDKIDYIWKSLGDETRPRKYSYIMNRVVTKEKSENNKNTIYNMTKLSSSNIQTDVYRKKFNDTVVNTSDSDENLVLKYSNDNFNDTKDTIRAFDETSAGTRNTNVDSSSCTHECGLQKIDNYDIDKYNTKFLYDSLHLPTTTSYSTKPIQSIKTDTDSNSSELEKDKCDCKMVPVCHVKMLVNNIEKKLIESKCTCDSLNSQVCPVHSINMEEIGRYKTDDSDKSKKRNKPNVISKLFICWVCPVLFKGNKRDVEEDDLIVPNKPYDSDRLGEKIQRYWLDEYQRAIKESRKPSLGKALMRAFWLAYMPGAILLLINATARTVQPLLFSELLSYWSANPEQMITRREAGFYAIGMLVLNMISAFSQHHNSLFVNRFSLKMKIACSSLIYRKVLRMSQLSINEVAAGKLVNLLSNDVARFDMAFMFLHYLWLVPLQLAVVMYFLYVAAGYAPFVGLFGVILFILPIQAVLTKFTGVIRRVVAQRTDKRIKLMGEIIKGIQVIKMYAWEKSFEQVVKVVRAFELAALRKSIFVRSVFLGFMMYAERSTLFITSLTIILSGTLLRADLIYPVKVFLGIVQINLTFILPLAIASLSELNVSLGRIQNVLIMDEREDLSLLTNGNEPQIPITFNGKPSTIGTNSIVVRKYSTTEKLSRPSIVGPRSPTVGEYTVELSNVNATWTKSDEMTLKNITVNIRKGKLCAIVGSVGSGKSSFLQVLLRELPISSGHLNVKGSMSYACQDSWLFPATVRENILFGLPYEVERYKEVCRACSLAPDFKQFPYGDLSLVGERGVSLSGGQRARINLARAVYREADIYLLDDPLSAVDANVGRQLFERCIQKYLSGRTRILVTHQVHFLKSADFIVVLKEGSIKNMGSYEDLVKSEAEFSSLVSEVKESTEEGKTEKDNNRPKLEHTISKVSVRSNENPKEEKEQIMAAEERAKGNLKWEVIRHYLASVNSWLVVFLAVFAVLVTQFGATFSDYWLSYWTNQVDDYELSLPPGVTPDTSLGTQMGPLTTGQYLWIYGGAVLFIIIMTNVRIAGFVMMTMRASQNLHDVMFKNLIAAVMRFFDTNPSGRVLNRFSKDMGAMDEMLPRSILESIQMYLFVASVLVLNALALPYTLIPTAILLVIFVFLLKWYLNAAQAVKRLESTTKSPVFSMINSTIAGLSTVRSSNSQFRLLRMFDDAQDINTSAFYTFLGGSSCFGLYMDLLCLIYLGIILAIFLLIDFEDAVAVGSVGLAVSQSMALTMMLQMAARVTAELLAQMTSVERVLEYSLLPAEENMETAKILPPENWPSDGQVQFENVSLRYAEEDPPVLKNLTFTIKSGWKVGIVGRTGAGKSSLISALFRLSSIQGSIKIDGVDTNDIPKKELRSKISIIPQEPVLFSATLRYNLDPFFLYSDDEIWRALEQVELKDAVTSLDFNVSEGGTNFSVGQRQLVCLARAVLRSNKILVMDEATANVDPQTDALIQTTIRRQFASCTVLTIAHRLNTIMDSDRILVMDNGEVAEFDHPHILLSNPKSLLNFMVRETGTSMSGLLFETAKNKYFSENEEISKDK
ncbi:uncharacterized protein LOC123864713 [Maniola jurtina]|uniref:uncharacterized protein LOC123864713 n=1 Tax=Maniola jurtina TaxID=191418 RepID=UPI001E68A92B|nr:uncharacterized protein LOC123864713 [Maniola jurtina]